MVRVMSDYIKREDAVKWLTNLRTDCGQIPQMWHYGEAVERIIKLLDEDVAPVVRCKDCIHRTVALSTMEGATGCELIRGTFYEYFFCASGERKDNLRGHKWER